MPDIGIARACIIYMPYSIPTNALASNNYEYLYEHPYLIFLL